MKNYVQNGKVVNYTNATGSTIVSGAVVIMGALVGVAAADILDTKTGAVNVDGVFSLPKTNPLAISQGDELFYNSGTGKVTKTATDKAIGTAFEDAGSTDDTVNVKIYGQGNGVPIAGTVAALGSTTNLSAIAGTYADLAAARTSVNTLAGEVEARLDAIETKVDAILSSLKTAGLMA